MFTVQGHFLCSSIFKNFHTWSSYFEFKLNFCNMLCWYSGKDTGLSPGRPQFKPSTTKPFCKKLSFENSLKKWLSSRRIIIWPLKRGEIIRNPSLHASSRDATRANLVVAISSCRGGWLWKSMHWKSLKELPNRAIKLTFSWHNMNGKECRSTDYSAELRPWLFRTIWQLCNFF